MRHFYLLVSGMILAFCGFNAGAIDLQTGLVAYYPFNGNLKDSTVNANNGAVHGVSTGAQFVKDRNGRDSSALSLNGGWIVVPSANCFHFKNSFTITAWVKPTANGAVVSIPRKLGGSGIRFDVSKSGESICFNNDMPGYKGMNYNFTAPANLKSADWYFAAITYNGDSICLWSDTNLANSGKFNLDSLFPSDQPLYIGCESSELGDYYSGTVDEIRLYNRALSKQEIQGLFADSISTVVNPPQNVKAGLSVYYPFNGNANDESGNGKNCTVSNATLTTDRFGNSNSAYLFNGLNSYLTAGTQSFVLPMTVSLWFNSPNVNTVWRTLIDWQDMSMPGLQIYCVGNGSIGARLGAWQNFSDPFLDNDLKSSAKVDGTPNWHMVTLTKDTIHNLRLYIDGKLDTSMIDSGAIGNNHRLFIGQDHTGGSGYHFIGKIDDVRIYNRVLSKEDIDTLFGPITTKTEKGFLPLKEPTKIEVSYLPNKGVRFNEIPLNSKINIYNINGTLIRTLSNENVWDRKNINGYITPCGFYVAFIKYGKTMQELKLLIK